MKSAVGLIVVAAAALGGCPNGDHANAAEQARKASDFLYSVGVNIHSNYYGTPYDDFAAYEQAMLAGGIYHVRTNYAPGDSKNDRYITEMARNGIVVTIVVDNATGSYSPQGLHDYLVDHPSVLAAITYIENPNEQSSAAPENWVSNTRDYARTLWDIMKHDPRTARIKLIAPSITWDGKQYMTAARLGNLSAYVDYGNVHAANAGLSVTDVFLRNAIAVAQIVAPGKPMVFTENDYATAVGVDWVSQGGWPPTDENILGIILQNGYLNSFRLGIGYMDYYELVDIGCDGAFHHSFGLLRCDYSPKASYAALKRMTSLLMDDPQVDFVPGTLAYRIVGGDPYNHSVLLQKHDGSFWLAIWEDREVWNNRSAIPANPQNMPVTVILASLASGAIYVPYDHGSDPILTFRDARSFSINASPKPTFIEIDRGPPRQ